MEKGFPGSSKQGLPVSVSLVFLFLSMIFHYSGCTPVSEDISADSTDRPIPSEVAKVVFARNNVDQRSDQKQMQVKFDQEQESLLWLSDSSAEATVVRVLGSPSLIGQEMVGVGHVSCFFRGNPVFIAAGENQDNFNPALPENRIASHFNTLLIDNQSAQSGKASLNVHKIRERGGSVRVNPSACFPNLDHWFRDVFWTENEFRVVDDILFGLGKRGKLELNWNFAAADTDEEILIFRTEKRCRLETRRGIIDIQCNRPFELTCEKRTSQAGGDFFGNQYRRVTLQIESEFPSARIITKYFPRSSNGSP